MVGARGRHMAAEEAYIVLGGKPEVKGEHCRVP